MFSFLKKALLTGYNLFLFIILIITIQNSSQREKINLLGKESIELPLSFIMGTSFIVGSTTGSLSPIKIF